MGPPERAEDRACAHAARRDRRDLRKPAECHGGCRRALPQGRQRRHPALRLGFAAFVRGDPRLPGGGAEEGRASGACHPARARQRSNGRRRDAARPRRRDRRHRTARWKKPGRPRAERSARSGLCPSRRALPCLRRRICGSRNGATDHRQRQDAAHRYLRCRRDAADRPRRSLHPPRADRRSAA